MSAYVASDGIEDFYTPVGAYIFDFLENIAWQYSSVRDIVTYMRKLNLSGAGQGKMRPWSFDVLSEETCKKIYQLQNGGFWNEWEMVI